MTKLVHAQLNLTEQKLLWIHKNRNFPTHILDKLGNPKGDGTTKTKLFKGMYGLKLESLISKRLGFPNIISPVSRMDILGASY